jgi:hypothetical protein
MEPILGAWRDEAYVLMRFMMGFMLTCHGPSPSLRISPADSRLGLRSQDGSSSIPSLYTMF